VDIGAIVGGVVGGVSFVGIGSGLIAFIILRKRKRFATTPSTYTAYASPQTMMSEGEMKYNSTVPTMTSGKLYVSPVQRASLICSYPDGLAQDPNDPSTFPSEFPSDPVGYSTYSGSPSQRVTPTITGNATLVAVPVSARTQYTGAPEV
jgi:hypothetical protein